MNKQTTLIYLAFVLFGFFFHSCSGSTSNKDDAAIVSVHRASDLTSTNIRQYILQTLNTGVNELNKQVQTCETSNFKKHLSNLSFKDTPLLGQFGKQSPYRLQSNTNLYWDMCSEGLLDHTTLPSACAGQILGKKQHTIPVYDKEAALKYAKDTINSIRDGATTTNRRLPSVSELFGIVNPTCQNPSINLSLFPNTINGGYWAVSDDGTELVAIDFSDGSIRYDTDDAQYSIRLVRSSANNKIRKNEQSFINRHIITPRFRD